jgi:hypothetical protein
MATYADAQHPHLENAAYVVIHTVEALTHRFAAHPEDAAITQVALQGELVMMLEGNLKRTEGTSPSPHPNVFNVALEFPQPEGFGQQGDARVSRG